MAQDLPYEANDRTFGHFGDLLRGALPLKYAVWLYGVAGSIILALPINFINAAGIQVPSNSAAQTGLLTYCLFLIAYAFLTSIGIWRSANRYAGFFFWPVLSKFSVLIVLSIIVIAFLYGLLT